MSITPDYRRDSRVVLTLDAGGTSFRFFATRGGVTVAEIPPVASDTANLDRCLASIVDGFAGVQARCPRAPVAISFAFPGPANYAAGIIGDLPNLPAFRGGVALGPMLAERFGLPVFVNNDGSLFAYGEAIGGFLPYVNNLLAVAGSPRRYRNLLGVTLGTGFGGGLVHDGELVIGDNSAAGHVWLLRDKLHPGRNADEGVSIRAVRRVYAELAGIALEQVPDPRIIADIGRGKIPGDRPAAVESFRRLGEIAGDAIAQALTVFDGIAVVGGGLSNAADLTFPALVAAMNAPFDSPVGALRRLGPRAFDLEELAGRALFCQRQTRTLPIPGSERAIADEWSPRTAVGRSRLGTSEAIALGAYAFALRAMDRAA